MNLEDKNLEEKIIQIIKSEMVSNLHQVNEDLKKIRQTKQKENRYKIDKILKSLPQLERFIETEVINHNEDEETIDKTRTKLMLKEIYKILDNYLCEDINQFGENKTKEPMKIKQKILRRYYGYKPKENETIIQDKTELSEKLFLVERTFIRYQQELLNDLAPSFFGIDGLVL